jgi:uncharacterized protein (TIGR02118 family)
MASSLRTTKTAAVVSYPSKHAETGDDLKFDMNYYLSDHMPLIEKAWGPFGMRSWSINQLPNPDPVTGQAPPYGVQTTIYFDTVDDFKKALGGPMAEECSNDVKKFSNVYPSIWVGEITGTQSY